MTMKINYRGGLKDLSGYFVSLGTYRVDHDLGHTQYDVFTQAKAFNDVIIVTGIYPNYCTIETRNRATGALSNCKFSFHIVGQNYPIANI